MQRLVLVFKNTYAGFYQVAVQQAGGGLDNWHVGFALQNQADPHTAPRGPAHLPEQQVAREKIGIGNHHPVACRPNGDTVVFFNISGVFAVVASDKNCIGLTRNGQASDQLFIAATAACGHFGLARRRTASACVALARPQRPVGKVVDHGNQWPFNFNRVVLLGLGAEISQMVGRKIDAADKGALVINHHNLAVHAPEHIGAPTPEPGARVENMHAYASTRKAAQKRRRQVGRTKTVYGQVNLHTPRRRLQQMPMQRLANLVFKQNKGFQHHLPARTGNAGKHAWKKLLAVFKQRERVA